MRQVNQDSITLTDDQGLAKYTVPYYVCEVLNLVTPMQRVSGIKFLRLWWYDKHGTNLGLKEAKDICDWLLDNPNYRN